MKLKHILILLALLLTVTSSVFASEETSEEITDTTEITGTGYDSFAFLTDGNTGSYKNSAESAQLILSNPAGIGGIYIMFDIEYGAYTITEPNTGKTITAGQYNMLHEFIDLSEAFGGPVKSIAISFSNGKVRMSEIRVFTEGTPPANVQLWQPPLDGKTDLLLLATHGDDDQLFFAGLLPYYAGELGVNVQVAYMTDHRNLTNARTHEMLNGLWSVGVTAYPVFGEFADFRIDSLQGTYDEYRRLGTDKTELLEFVVTQLRRFKPLVVVGHDLNGEYGHGMHMVYSDLLVQALDITNDATQYPDIADKYGVWDVQKAYLHLYEANAITLDYDTPLEHFDGMTAFEVTQKKGYPCHLSQQYTWFTDWINGKNVPITKATEIATYNPCNFGLYRTTVGADVKKNDFLENIVTYAEQERLEQERLEQERLEQERLEQERLEKEQQEQAQKDENAHISQQPNHQEHTGDQKENSSLLPACILLIVLCLVLILVIIKLSNNNRRR